MHSILKQTQSTVDFPDQSSTLMLLMVAVINSFHPLLYLQVIWEGRIQFLNSVCINCLEGRRDISCAACKRKWDGSTFVIGTMYTYDIFAAMPCCQKRLTCKHCRRAVVDVHHGLNYFSQYSHMIICPYCKANDYHFVRPLGETFLIKASIY